MSDRDMDEEPQEDEMFDLSKKKKKGKKKEVVEENIDDIDDIDEDEDDDDDKILGDENEEDDGTVAFGEAKEAWLSSDRDYTYDELLHRIFGQMYESNPELKGERKKYVIKPPQVVREGTKKTVWTNFPDICTAMKRTQEHVLAFVLAELGANGSTDLQGQLTIKGRFQPRQIENILRRYIVEYVTCRTCRSPDTAITKKNRLFFVTCVHCNSSRSVPPVSKGFQAQVGKRRLMKAKEQ